MRERSAHLECDAPIISKNETLGVRITIGKEQKYWDKEGVKYYQPFTVTSH